MSKKILSTVIIVIMILTFLQSINYVKNNLEFTKENVKISQNVIFDKISATSYFPDYPTMEVPISYPAIKGVTYPIRDDLPKEFSWTNYNGKDWTTPVKHQGSCGSCWAFAPLGIFESMVKIREGNAELNPNFSEQYVLSCFPAAGSCRGGMAWEALRLLQEETSIGNNANGTIFEECFPYQADDDIPCSDKCTEWDEMLVPILDWGYWDSHGTSNDRKAIKSYIFENGPVVAHMRVTKWFKIFGAIIQNSDFFYPRFRPIVGINHVLMIVGWKDISFIPSGGYWICKNSWGTDWGYDGFVNIAYGSLNIDKSLIVWADYDPDSYNWPPVADAGGSYGAYIGEAVTFDASRSYGYEGEIINYYWEFGDGSNDTGIKTSKTFSELGRYILSLTVKDVKNSKSSDNTYVWIQESNDPPNKLRIRGPISGKVGLKYLYNIVSEDSDGNDVWYTINWGDDTPEERIGPFASGEEASISHTWSKKGSYTVKAKVKDVFNDESPWTELPVYMQKNRIPNYTLFTWLLGRLSIGLH
jgi:hypothetical protein